MSTSARRQVAAYIALLAFTILLLAFSSSGPLLELRRGVGFALSPIQDTLRQGTRTATSIFTTISEIERLRQQNEDLTRRIQEVEAENQRLQSLAVENEQLAALLEVRSSLSYSTVAAEVINRLTTDQERVVSLDQGSDAGVGVDDPVVGEGGALVGRVTEVGPNFSRVLLVSDTRTNVAGLIETSRAVGDIRGNGERPLQMTNIPATDAVNIGESVVTAGIELETGVRSTYPKGLLIGTIVDVQRQPNQLFQTALVQPVAALDRLEYVLVIVDYEGGLPEVSPGPSNAPTTVPTSVPAPSPSNAASPSAT
ncbi:MAG: rod shape-determining protein MreC [Candidatus Limnocylindrales bacterium]